MSFSAIHGGMLAVALVGAALLWLKPPPLGARWLRGLAVVWLLGGVGTHLWGPGPGAVGWGEVEQRYLDTWGQLDRAADGLATELRSVDPGPRPGLRLELFRRLQENAGWLEAPGLGDRGATVLLFDADDEAIAWHGPGLLHEPEIWALPSDGHSWHRADTAVSLWTVRTLQQGDEARRRLVVGLSLPVDPFPFAQMIEPVDWFMADPKAGTPEGVRILAQDSKVPLLCINPAADVASPALIGKGRSDVEPTFRMGFYSSEIWVALGLMVIFLWGSFHLLTGEGERSSGPAGPGRLWVPAVAVMTLIALGGAGLITGGSVIAASAAALAVTSLVWVLGAVLTAQRTSPDRKGAADESAGDEISGDEGDARNGDARSGDTRKSVWQPMLPIVLGVGGFAALVAFSHFIQDSQGPLNLAGSDGFTIHALLLRSAVAAVALAVLLKIPRRRGGGSPWLSTALVALLVAAAFHDRAGVAILMGGIGSGSFAFWWSRTRGRSSPALLAVVALAAALMASNAWQIAERMVLRAQIQNLYLPLVVPPTDDDLNDLLLELQGYFEAWNPGKSGLATLSSAPFSSREDLAFELWRDSPLPQRDGLSALVVEDLQGRRSSFSFGLPLGGDGEPLPGVGRLRVPQAGVWTEKVYGEADVYSGDLLWGRVRYWFLARPGFRIGIDELDELERYLVRGKPRGDMADGLPREVRYAYFNPLGRALASPWQTLPPLPPDLVESLHERSRLDTPDGPSLCWLKSDDDGITALFLPDLGPREGLERVGFVALGMVPALIFAAWLIWLIPSTRPGLVELFRRSLRSYSSRLIMVYTVLLLVPLVALNLILLRSFSERLQEKQVEDAQRAMVSARELLVNFLNGLQPGVAIETQVNRELLEWMSDLVQYQVSLYWGSRIYRSSQEELFTSGLLPRRIPGEIFTRLTLLGHGMELRRRRTGDLAYLEVYAPLDVPGVVSSQQELFVSVPLLEQEEAAERQLAELQRRALLVTTALFGLLLAVGSRLTRGFTRPIVELIAGTRRIARGEPFPDIRPRETELSALAEAIGTMARQVEESRQSLVHEKQFVERVVANITSAVVTLDHEDRVAFQNQVAADLLGTRVGEPIEDRLTADDHLAPLREFWVQARNGKVQHTEQVKLRPIGETVDVREWTLTWVPIPGHTDPAALLVVDDDTEVLRGQRLEAWAEMARIIAHEIKNPLTPIQLSAEHLRQVYRVDPGRLDEVFDRCTDNILANVEELRAIASEFSIYSRIPAAKLESADLTKPMAELVASYRDAEERGVTLEMKPPERPLIARFDEKLLGRAVRNLLENAYRAAAPSQGRVELAVSSEVGPNQERWAVVEVSDSGPGVDPQKLSRIFEPYFSTYETGTGLGLAIVRRIVDEHGGEIEARNRPGGGLSVIIRIPLAVSSADPTTPS